LAVVKTCKWSKTSFSKR